jgi:hypothetical protein
MERRYVTEGLVTYPEQKVEREEDALGAFQSAADGHGCQDVKGAAAHLRLRGPLFHQP